MNDIDIIVSQIKTLLLNEIGVPTIEQLRSRYDLMKTMDAKMLAMVLNTSGAPIDWEKVWFTLETQIQVKHQLGAGLDDPSSNYDKTWFSTFKNENRIRYYSDRFLKTIARRIPSQVLYTLQQDTEQIMNLIGAPNRAEEKDIRGLVFGYVQAGKTLNYTSVANAAMDSGYNLIVILAGATNILRSQTQSRIIEDLIGFDSGRNLGVGLIDNDNARRPISLTSRDQDFDKHIAAQNMGSATLQTVTVPVIAVIKKNVFALSNINSWLQSQNPTGKLKKSVLIIDDESDFGSVNTKKEEDPTAINRGIREMLNHFDVSSYCAITATPFANILIDVNNENDELGIDLFPKSFIWTLDKPSTYLGVEQIVVNKFRDVTLVSGDGYREEATHLVESILKFKSDNSFTSLPPFVSYALGDYLFNAVKLRFQLSYEGDLSMMINLSRFTSHHEQLARLVYSRLDMVRIDIRNNSLVNSSDSILIDVLRRFRTDKSLKMSILKFENLLEEVINSISVLEVHSRSRSVVHFTGRGSVNHIVIGGLSLSRGFTVEGLITSVFLRATSTYDALMQMGRWFGHKEKFADYISLYTTTRIRSRFEGIQRATEDLIDQLLDMRDKGETPKNFGLAIQLDPEIAMQVVASNKRKDAERITINMSIEGKTCETTRIYSSATECMNNELTLDFITKSFTSGQRLDESAGVYVPNNAFEKCLRRVPVGILIEYIEKFEMPHKKLSELSNKMPYKFILRHLNDYATEFDIMLVDGDHEECVDFWNGTSRLSINQSLRLFDIKEDYIQLKNNQLSTGARLESTFLDAPCQTRYEAAKRREELGLPPLLLLYKVFARDAQKNPLGSYWSWSLVIPGDSIRQKKIMGYGNSVLLRELAQDDGFEDEKVFAEVMDLNED
jgi:hypothetical protein